MYFVSGREFCIDKSATVSTLIGIFKTITEPALAPAFISIGSGRKSSSGALNILPSELMPDTLVMPILP